MCKTIITKNLIAQYELIRQMGKTNMLDYYRVIDIALQCELNELANCTKDDYIHILKNYDTLIKQIDI